MSRQHGSAILHIVNSGGGGTARYVESLIGSPHSNYRHFVLYVNTAQSVLYDVDAKYYHAVACSPQHEHYVDLLVNLVKESGVVRLAIHLHSLFSEALNVAEMLCSFAITATLHDHHFLSETPFVDAKIAVDLEHVRRVQTLLGKDSSLIVPSQYLYEQALPYFSAEQLAVIPHAGESCAEQLDSETQQFIDKLKLRANWQDDKMTVAAVGAINNDKGLLGLDRWLATLKHQPIQFVMLGYTSHTSVAQAKSGYIQHGFYHYTELVALLSAYRVDGVIFFAGIPESFNYALSDIHATVPVLAPDYGALGERVATEHLGEVYSPDCSMAELTSRFINMTQRGFSPQATKQNISTMTQKTEYYYQLHEIEDIPHLQLTSQDISALLADKLDSSNLSWELAKLSRQRFLLDEQIGTQQQHLESQAQYIETLRQETFATRNEVQAMQQTLSWKITKPIRLVRRFLKFK